MIIVITYTHINERTGCKEVRVSHGVDYDTLNKVVLPDCTLDEIGAIWDSRINEWVLY